MHSAESSELLSLRSPLVKVGLRPVRPIQLFLALQLRMETLKMHKGGQLWSITSMIREDIIRMASQQEGRLLCQAVQKNRP